MDDKIVVESLPFDEKGEKIEPEAQIAKRVLDTQAPVSHGSQTPGAIPIQIEQYTAAGLMAAMLRDTCGSCKYFDRTAMRQHMKVLQQTHEGRVKINNLIAHLIASQCYELQDLHTGPDGDFDTNASLNVLGICRILTEMARDEVVVHPLSSCPEGVRSPQKPRGEFVPRTLDDEKAGSAAFDQIMRAAQGRK